MKESYLKSPLTVLPLRLTKNKLKKVFQTRFHILQFSIFFFPFISCKVPIDDKDQWSSTSLVSNFFNLDIMIRRVDKYCPVKDKNAIFRDVLKNIFLVRYSQF